MPYGRGGAGNIEAQQREQAQAATDLEAQRKVYEPPASDTSEPAEYAYSGRGGMGNIYSPRELATSGSFAATEVIDSDYANPSQADLPSHLEGRRPSVVSIQQSTTPTIRKVGRGGAGNYEYSAPQAQEVRNLELEKEKQREIELNVAQDVDDQLAVPPKARIPTAGGVYRG